MIREYKPSDLDRIMEIWLNSNLEAHNFIDENYWKNNFEFVKSVIATSELFVAEENNQIVGFIGLIGGYIAGIFVDKNFRGKGIGKALLVEAKKRNFNLTVNVYVRNNNAIRFYLKNEFELVTKVTNPDTGEEECEMTWQKTACMMGGSC